MSRSSNIGVWVVGAVALIALAVFGVLWLSQTTLIARIDGVSKESRRQNKKLQAKVGELRREIRKLEGRLSQPSAPAQSPVDASTPPSTKKSERIYVRITSTPKGARVRRDKRTIGRTPLVLPMDKSETATLLLTRKGYHDEEVTITGEDGNALEVRLRRRGSRESP